MKVPFGMALRQIEPCCATGSSNHGEAGSSRACCAWLVWSVPFVGQSFHRKDHCFSTLSRRQKTLAVNIPYRGSKGPQPRLIDSTGIKVEGEGDWHARKHGGRKRRVWRKIHLGIDAQTLEVRAVEITASHIGDAPVLPDLLGQIPSDEQIGCVTADGAYDTRKCHDAIADRGAHAVIPPRSQGRRSLPAPWRATKRCGPANTSAALCGDDGVAITGGAARNMRRIRKRSGGSFSRRLDALPEASGTAAHGARLRPP
jgi:hypothetical protein